MTKQRTVKKGLVPHKILSERGLHLEQAHQRQQNSSIGFGKVSVLVGENADGSEISVKIGEKCPKCMKRVRHLNHAKGSHHLGTKPRYRGRR